MTPNPECATVDTPIVDALHTMHDGKFLHLPVVDRGDMSYYLAKNICCMHIKLVLNKFLWLDADGEIVAVVDVIHITHAAVATVSQVSIVLRLVFLK